MAFSRDRSYPSGSQSLSNRSMVALAVVVMLASGLAYLGFAAHPGSAQEESNPRTRSGAGFGLGGWGCPPTETSYINRTRIISSSLCLCRMGSTPVSRPQT
jgi:hypothetical protein